MGWYASSFPWGAGPQWSVVDDLPYRRWLSAWRWLPGNYGLHHCIHAPGARRICFGARRGDIAFVYIVPFVWNDEAPSVSINLWRLHFERESYWQHPFSSLLRVDVPATRDGEPVCLNVTAPPPDATWDDLITGIRMPFWIPVVLLGSYPALAFVRGPLRRWRRGRAGHCRKCGYNLTGNQSGICPECGSEIQHDAPNRPLKNVASPLVGDENHSKTPPTRGGATPG